MTAYMGPAFGQMVPIECSASLQATPERAVSFRTNLSGHRRGYTAPPAVPGGPMPAARRRWSLSTHTRSPAALGVLVELEQLGGSLRFIPDVATQTNILAPDVAAGLGWSNLSWAGPRQTPDGVAMLAFQGNTSPAFPVFPDVPVTIAAYCQPSTATATTMRIQWLDPTGAVVASVAPVLVSGSGMPRRSTHAVPPAGIHSARFSFTGAPAVIARPTVTYGTRLAPWSPGMGADAVVLEPATHSPWATRDGRRYVNFDYTVTEVG